MNNLSVITIIYEIISKSSVGVLLIISLFLALLVSWVYRKTHRGFSYSQSFSITLIILTVVATMIFVLIQDNVAVAIGIFGAFSIIRFRTAIKDARDTAFVFLALATGLGVGVGLLPETIISVIMISAIIMLLDYLNLGASQRFDYILNFSLDSKEKDLELYKEVFSKYLDRHEMMNVTTLETKHKLEFTFHINIQRKKSLASFIEALRGIHNLNGINIVHAKNDLEY